MEANMDYGDNTEVSKYTRTLIVHENSLISSKINLENIAVVFKHSKKQ